MTLDANTVSSFLTSSSVASIPFLLAVIAFFGKRTVDSLDRMSTSQTTLQVGHAELKVRVEVLEDGHEDHGRQIEHLQGILKKG